MNEKDDTTPFPREPWQRIFDDADGPPETTDARIRAAARRDLAPRFHRWWLPASLAASFVLAVFVVQSQFGTLRAPVARESDRGAGSAITARIVDREEAKEARPPGAAPSAAGKRAAPAREADLADAYGHLDSELAADSAGTGPMIGGPERELKEAMERPQVSGAAGEPRVVTDLPTPPPADNDALADSRSPRDEVAAAARQSPMQAMVESPPFEKTPETWYAYIEKLRTQGKIEEADRQLARLEEAHPGWVERYLRDRAER
jgi:hypothetical protein